LQSSNITSDSRHKKFFYGFIIVMASFFILLVYSASRSAFSIFFNPILDQYHWSAALLSGVFSLSIIMDGVSGIFWGQVCDRIGPRLVLIISAVLAGTGYILSGLAQSVWQLYLIYGLMVGIGMGGVFNPVATTIPRWFKARRNTAQGIAVAGLGVGTLIISPIAYWLVSRHSWAYAYAVIGVVFIVIIVIGALFMKLDPAQVNDKPYSKTGKNDKVLKNAARDFSLKEAIRTPQIWITICMFFCFGYSMISLSVHLVPHIINIDISAALAATVLSLVGAFNIVGRLLFGAIGDRIGSIQGYALGFAIGFVSLLAMLFMHQAWMFFVFAAFWGLCSGGIGSVQTTVIAELFGLKSLGLIFGFCGLGVMIGGSIGPVVTGYLFDIQGNYIAAFIVCAIFTVMGIVFNYWLRRYHH
jgi:MFS family permease